MANTAKNILDSMMVVPVCMVVLAMNQLAGVK